MVKKSCDWADNKPQNFSRVLCQYPSYRHTDHSHQCIMLPPYGTAA